MNTTEFPDIELDEETKVKILPPFKVIIENDDAHSMLFVLNVLSNVFGYSGERCYVLMMEAHQKGRAIVWVGSKEVAELKLEQIATHKEGKAGMLGAYMEES